MHFVLHQVPLYRFLWFCENSPLEKKVLDCGAGGRLPPLALFKQFRYETYGIEIDDDQLSRARDFEKKHGLELNIIKGDMRVLPYEDQSFSFAFSYNTIFHLSKKDIKKAVAEIDRVLRNDALFFVNFLSTEDGRCGDGKEISPGEWARYDYGEEIVHTFYTEEDLYEILNGYTLLYLEKNTIQMPKQWGDYIAGMYECVVQKNP